MTRTSSGGGSWSGSWYKESCVLLFGDTGLGKSTLLNLVTGHSIQTGDGANGTTDVNKIYDDLSHPERPKWMDTVGLNEARYNEDPFDVYQTYLKMLKVENINCIHAVIWAIPTSVVLKPRGSKSQNKCQNYGRSWTNGNTCKLWSL